MRWLPDIGIIYSMQIVGMQTIWNVKRNAIWKRNKKCVGRNCPHNSYDMKEDIMNFELTEQQKAIQEAARKFAQEELLPGVLERDEKSEFPV